MDVLLSGASRSPSFNECQSGVVSGLYISCVLPYSTTSLAFVNNADCLRSKPARFLDFVYDLKLVGWRSYPITFARSFRRFRLAVTDAARAADRQRTIVARKIGVAVFVLGVCFAHLNTPHIPAIKRTTSAIIMKTKNGRRMTRGRVVCGSDFGMALLVFIIVIHFNAALRAIRHPFIG